MLLQALARGMDIVDAEGEMAEVARAAVVLVVVVVGQFDLDLGIRRCAEIDQRENGPADSPCVARLDETERVTEEAQARVEVTHAHHRVEISHKNSVGLNGCERTDLVEEQVRQRGSCTGATASMAEVLDAGALERFLVEGTVR